MQQHVYLVYKTGRMKSAAPRCLIGSVVDDEILVAMVDLDELWKPFQSPKQMTIDQHRGLYNNWK